MHVVTGAAQPATSAARSVGAAWVVPQDRWRLVPPTAWRPPRSVSVGVVVCHHAQPDELRRALDALDAAGCEVAALDVVVADDGSPHAPDVGEPVVVQRDAGFRAARARAAAAPEVEGEVVVFLDADMVVEAGTLGLLASTAATLPDALVVGRRRHARLEGLGGARIWRLGVPPARWLDDPAWLDDGYAERDDLEQPGDDGHHFVLSAVLACSRDLHDRVGGFDSSMVGYGGEDWELAFRAVQHGAVLVHRREAVAWHDGPDVAGRGDPGWRYWRDDEVVRLAERTTDPLVRLPGRLHALADVTVDLHLELGEPSRPLADVMTCVADLLQHGDVRVGLVGPGAADAVARIADPRVRAGSVRPEHVPGARLGRLHVVLREPVALRPRALDVLLERTRPGGVGRVRTEDGALVATSNRARGRAQRWAPDRRSRDRLVTELFGELVVDTATIGLEPLGKDDLHHRVAVRRRASHITTPTPRPDTEPRPMPDVPHETIGDDDADEGAPEGVVPDEHQSDRADLDKRDRGAEAEKVHSEAQLQPEQDEAPPGE